MQAPLPRAEAQRIIDTIERKVKEGFAPPGVPTGKGRGAVAAAIRELYPTISGGSIHGKFRSAVKAIGREPDWNGAGRADLEFPVFPDASVPTAELIDRLAADFERRHHAERARKWYAVKVKIPGPIGIAWLGDPHVDDNGCNWPLLRRHIEIIRSTPGMFAANIGDSENNWAGRLAHLYSQQDTSRATAKQLVEWLFSHSGVQWLLLLLGNHDVWGGNGDALQRIARGGAPISDWSAQFRLHFANGREAKIWAAHDFPGHSMWNPLHGPAKAARFVGGAHLYVCGHKHNWSLFHNEDEHRGDVYWLARARGYKHLDSYADKLGFGSQAHGSAIVSVFDPDAEGPNFLQCFADLEAAADYLTWLRQKRGCE